MKPIFLTVSVVAFLVACGSQPVSSSDSSFVDSALPCQPEKLSVPLQKLVSDYLPLASVSGKEASEKISGEGGAAVSVPVLLDVRTRKMTKNDTALLEHSDAIIEAASATYQRASVRVSGWKAVCHLTSLSFVDRVDISSDKQMR